MRIWLDRPHPRKLPLTFLGDSIGRWEGDTLVVDTVGLNDRTFIDDEGSAHSTQLHVVERYRKIEGGAKLELVMTVEEARPDAGSRKLDLFVAPLGEEAKRHVGVVARDLRRGGLVVEVSTDHKLKRALEVANKLGARFALMVGDNEIAAASYQLKNMTTGDQRQVTQAQIAEMVSEN